MNNIRLHNHKLASKASLKEIDESIKWFENSVKDIPDQFVGTKSYFKEKLENLRAYRVSRIGEN